jgi:hypothetical protein
MPVDQLITLEEVEAEAQRCRAILDNEPPDEGSDMLYAAYNALLFVLGYGVEVPSKQFHGPKWAMADYEINPPGDPILTRKPDGRWIYHEKGFDDCPIEDLPPGRMLGCIHDLIALIIKGMTI